MDTKEKIQYEKYLKIRKEYKKFKKLKHRVTALELVLSNNSEFIKILVLDNLDLTNNYTKVMTFLQNESVLTLDKAYLQLKKTKETETNN